LAPQAGFEPATNRLTGGRARLRRGQRCLVITNGFYEWKKLDPSGKKKQPCAIAMADDREIVMAGLWETRNSPASGEEVVSCTVITCCPNKVMGALHDRMPVILDEAHWPKWLGEDRVIVFMPPCAAEASSQL